MHVSAFLPNVPSRDAHGPFTTASPPQPIVADMTTNEATSIQPAVVGIIGTSSGRLGAASATLLGLIGVVLAGRALSRARGGTRPGDGLGATDRRDGGAVVAVALGTIALVVGGAMAATSDGGVGTGDGVAGAVAAAVLGLIAVALGALARARGRQGA
jgi:hypothetical protein